MERHVSHVIDTPALYREDLIIRLYTQGTFIVQVVVDKHEGSVEFPFIPVQQDNIIRKTIIVPDAHFFFNDMIQLRQIEVGKELGEIISDGYSVLRRVHDAVKQGEQPGIFQLPADHPFHDLMVYAWIKLAHINFQAVPGSIRIRLQITAELV